jgi:hypothetical protein
MLAFGNHHPITTVFATTNQCQDCYITILYIFAESAYTIVFCWLSHIFQEIVPTFSGSEIIPQIETW